MKKELYKNMSVCQGTDTSYYIPDPEYVEDNSEIANVLKEIFAVDKRSGLPRGDIAYYLSPDGNPEIKTWLMNNLMSSRGGSVGSSVEGITDDMMEELSRQPNESIDSYRKRIYDYGMEAKAFIESQNPKED